MQRYPQPISSWPPPPGVYPPPQGPYAAPRMGVAPPPTHKRAARVQQACDQCRLRKRRCDAMQPCDHCVREGHECLYTRSPNLKDDKLVNLITALTEKLEHVHETVRRVDRAHRNTQQYLLNGSKDPKPAMNEHRTPAHNLVSLWPSIHTMLDEAGIDIRDDYVAKAEDRPLLDPFSMRPVTDELAESPSAHHQRPNLLRATSLPQVPGQSQQYSREPALARQGGLRADGSLDLDRSTLESLLSSYFVNVHIMHPFLHKHKLRVMFDNFVEQFCGRPTTVDSATDPNTLYAQPRKRKRSLHDDRDDSSYNDDSVSFVASQHQRTEYATIWLVLALGKICQHKQPLPEVYDGAPDTDSMFSSAQSSSGDRSRATSMPPRKSLSSSSLVDWTGPAHAYTPSQHSADAALGDHQSTTSSSSGERNVDAVPGLAHYTKATEVLGTQVDGNTLAHAQMFLLAGLYKGQLARVRESMSWISKAGQVVRVLLEAEGLADSGQMSITTDVQKLSKSRNKDAYRDSIILTSWTCLQLESDILAELKIPSSGIPALDLMPYDIPDCGIDAHGRDMADATAFSHENVVLFYTAQTFLRTKLNQVHREIYGKLESDHPQQIRDMLGGHDLILTEWRTKLPLSLRWEDSDPPPTNILHARLRAKYWGARYIITRPFLDYVMHILPNTNSPSDVEKYAKDAQGEGRELADVRLLEAIAGMPQSEIWAAVQACVEAAMQSTVAFDGIPGRLIVTNIHGTAHAQFGNMLILAATYHNEQLRVYVPEPRLRYLLDRTISFLGRLAPISQTCKADCWILQRIRQWLLPQTQQGMADDIDLPERPSSGGSFGSTIAVAPPTRTDSRHGMPHEQAWRSRMGSVGDISTMDGRSSTMDTRSFASVCSDTR